MARPVYPYELGDPDFAWLLATFQESNPDFKLVDISCLPLLLVRVKSDQVSTTDAPTDMAHHQDALSDNDDEILEKND